MQNESNLYLILGCWGRVDDDFVTCNAVSNPILKISKELEGYEDLIKYLKFLNLFEQKITNYNAVRNILFAIKNKFPQGYKNLWDDRKFRIIENFMIVHKNCGIYLDLDFISNSYFDKYLDAHNRFVIIEPTK